MLSPMSSRFSASETPSATSTWKPELLPTRQTAPAVVSKRAARPGSLAALRPGRRVMPKAVRVARPRLGGSSKKALSTGLAPGQPASM